MRGPKIMLTGGRSSHERYYLLKDRRGMGGAGEPPGHYSHEWVVVNGIDRGNGYQGYMAVDYALKDDRLPPRAKAIIRQTLKIEEPK